MVRRYWIAASLTVVAGFGCHAGPPPKVTAPEAPISQADVSAARIIAQHNKNADAIFSLKANPSIVLIGEDEKREGSVRGGLAFERDKNFTLELETALGRDVAKIGSNDQGFWFWVDDKKDKVIYVCDHKDLNSCQLAVTLQPDWIIEAMGLRRFSDDEAQKIHAKAGDQPRTVLLTQFRKDAKGQVYTKETIVNEITGRILEHRLYLGAKKELLATATIVNYTESVVTSTARTAGADGEEPQDSAPVQVKVCTPEKFRLNWIKEKLALEISMPSVKVNQPYRKDERAALFTEPKIAGTNRRNLAQLDPDTVPAASSRVYNSKPMPQPGGIRLGSPQPASLGNDRTTRRAIDPLPLSPDLQSTPAQPAGVVGAMVPTAADTRDTAITNWRSATLGR